jgi:hypothetical protein
MTETTIKPGHPKHPSHLRGKSRSARQRRKLARAKAGWAAVEHHHELQRAMPIVRRKANELRRQKRSEKIAKNKRLREREAAFIASQPAVISIG